MKRIVLFAAIATFVSLQVNAQMQVNKSIDLTGTGADAKISGIQNVSAARDAVSVEALQAGKFITAASVTGTNNIVLNFAPAITVTVLQAGTMISFKAAGNNLAGGVTIAVDAIAGKTLFKNVSTPLAADDIKANQMVTVIYDGTNFQLLSRGEFTEADGSTSNEGTLGVGAGSATSSTLLSNTSGSAAVTLNAGTGLDISETPSANGGQVTLSLANTAVTPTSYGNATTVPTFTVDPQGRLTAAAGVAISGLLPAGSTTQTLRHNGSGWVANNIITNDGTNVGIGTASPGSALEVSASTTTLRITQIGHATSATLAFRSNVGGRATGDMWTQTAAITDGGGSGTDYEVGDLVFSGRAATTSSTLAEYLRINRGGFVGIGSTNPGAKLVVAGTTTGIGTAAEVNYHVIRSGSHTATGGSIKVIRLPGGIGTLRVVARSVSGTAYTTGEWRVINGGFNFPTEVSVTNLAIVNRGAGVGLSVNGSDGTGGGYQINIVANNGSLVFWSFDGVVESVGFSEQ